MAQPAQHFAPVDVERVMRLGGRRRARRRLLTGAAAVLALVIVAGSVIGVRIYRDSQAPTTITVAAPHAVTIGMAPVGSVVDTGVVDHEGHAVLYFAHVRDASGAARYQLVLAHKAADGTLTSVSADDADFTGDGFHGVTTGHPRSFLPLFGYFIGPVRQFKATYEGDTLSVLSQPVPELNVTVFWAAPKYDAEDINAASVVQLSAFDADGNLLKYGRGPGR
ncbi:hypothetical protein GCM10018954_068320 [Kutzneria kofuensis]